MVWQVFVRGLDGRSLCIQLEKSTVSGSELLHHVVKLQGFACLPSQFRLTTGTREIRQDTVVAAGPDGIFPSCCLSGRLLGGKGGFGSLLRGAATRAGQKKTTNFDACRDMSGRRLRHVNAEKKLREWRYDAKERRLEKLAQDYMKNLVKERKKAEHAIVVAGEVKARSAEAMDRVAESVKLATKRSRRVSMGDGKRRTSSPEDGDAGPVKKARLLEMVEGLEDVDSGSSSDEGGDAEEEESGEEASEAEVESEGDEEGEESEGMGPGAQGSSEEEGVGARSVEGSGAARLSAQQALCNSEPEESEGQGRGHPGANCGWLASVPPDPSPVSGAQSGCSSPWPTSGCSGPEGGPGDTQREVPAASPDERGPPQGGSALPGQGMHSPECEEQNNGQSGGEGGTVATAVGSSLLLGELNWEMVSSPGDLEVLGLEGLKFELSKRGLKCGGTLAERAARLFLLKHTPLDKLERRHRALPPMPASKRGLKNEKGQTRGGGGSAAVGS